jgi:hypothetical protein
LCIHKVFLFPADTNNRGTLRSKGISLTAQMQVTFCSGGDIMLTKEFD